MSSALVKVTKLKSPRERKSRLPDSLEQRVPHPSLFVQHRQPQYRGILQATAVASAGALHDARRNQTVPHFSIRPPSQLSKCFTFVYHTMPDGQILIVKDTSEKHTSISRPADHKAATKSTTSTSKNAEDGSDFDPSAFERSEKSIDFIVQRILPNIPHLVSVPTKTPYVREFPNENLNTPFDDWEVQNLQHMTLISNGSRGVAWARGDWSEEYNAASPYGGFRSGTATPRSERDANRIRTKIKLSDYTANKKPANTPQPSRLGGSQTVPNGQSRYGINPRHKKHVLICDSVSKNSVSPTQQMIDQIVENSKLVPKFSDDHPIDIARPPRPDPPYVSDAPHPNPMPKPQKQAEEGRVVWPPLQKPDWKQTQQQEGSSEQRTKLKRSDYVSVPPHPQQPSDQQKELEPEQKRRKLEEKQSSKKGAVKQLPPSSAMEPVSKPPRAPKTAPANVGKGEPAISQSSDTQNTNEKKSIASVGISIPSKQSNSSNKGSQKGLSGNEKPISIDVNISGSINAMPPLLSPLPAVLLSPDHPDLDDDTVSLSPKPNQITPPSSNKSKTADAGPAEKTQHDILSPLESPLEMPPKLSPLPDWWMEKITIDSEKLRLHDLETQATTIATLGARRERSRQPDTPGVARKMAKPNKLKSSLTKDLDPVEPSSFSSTKAGESTDRPHKKLGISGADREELIVKLKYGKRNSKTIIRLLQMTSRPLNETKNIPASAHSPAGTESRKHARIGDDTEEPSIKRNKVGKNDPPLPISSGIEARKHARQFEDTEESSTKRPKAINKESSLPTSSVSAAKKHARPADDIEEPSTKRSKVTGNVEVQRARTPLTPNAQSPGPSMAQKTFSTPKKNDAMKSVAMRRVDSNDGQVLTPHGGSVSTPASTEKPRTSGGEVKFAEMDALKAAHAKYTTIGTTLKRQADQILKIKEKDPGPVSDEEKKLGAVIAIESVVAYMFGFDSMDKLRHKERKIGYADPWSQFLPFMVFATERAKGQGELFTLALLLNAVSRECLERIFMERLTTEPAGTAPGFLKEVAKNSQMRQAAWSAYRDQCRDHPVDFATSIEEAKGITVTVLARYCKKMNIAWETKLEF